MKKYWIIILAVVIGFSGIMTARADHHKAEDEVAVTVNGTDIYENQVQQMLQPQLNQMQQQGHELPQEFMDQYVLQLRQQVLDQLITEQLLDQKIEEIGLEVTKEQAEEELAQIAAQQQPPMTIEDVKQIIAVSGESYETVIDDMRQRLGYTRLLEQQWEGKIDVTEEQARQYYQKNEEQFAVPEHVRASHILITPDPSADNAEAANEDAREKAQNLLAQIREGADFATMAGEHSECPSSANGGDLGEFGKGQMVPEFEQVAFAMEPGQVSDLVQTQFGWHIIKLTGKEGASVTSYEDIQPQLIEMLKQQQQAEIAEAYIQQLKDEAEIIYADSELAD